MLQLVDTENPPGRFVLGNVTRAIEAIYQERLRTWREWQPVALKTSGGPVS